MRSIDELMPEVKLSAPGVPDMLALYAITRALAEFLDRSWAWRDWLTPQTVADIGFDLHEGTSTGLMTWVGDLKQHIRYLDFVRWVPTGDQIQFKTVRELEVHDRLWRTRVGSRPVFWTTAGEGDNSEYQIQLYPIPGPTILSTDQIEARAVFVTDVVADVGLSPHDDLIPSIPDRLFYSYREGIVAGALGKLYLAPGRDWSDAKLGAAQLQIFEDKLQDAKTQAAVDFGYSVGKVRYGGYEGMDQIRWPGNYWNHYGRVW